MCDPKKDQKEQEWADRVPGEEEQEDAYEKTYRDGSAVHECWAQEKDSV